MVRRFLLRIPFLRAFPRVTAPLLPLRSSSSTPLSRSSNRPANSRLFNYFPTRLTSIHTPSPNPNPPEATLSQRLRNLIKSYGWYALGMYIVLSALDFGVAFLGINLLGAEQVSRLVASVKNMAASVWNSKPPEPGRDEMESTPPTGGGSHEGLYAMILLAYTIHKTVFVPMRVGLTAVLTPKLVGWLGRRGWVGGEGAKRAAIEMREKLRIPRNRD